ncbi:MAG: hypothetical protein ACO3OZ_17685, partial [bacterium]
QAWKAVLGGARFTNLNHMLRDINFHDANHTSTDIQNQVNYPAGFTRFPQSIQELFDVDVVGFDQDFDRHALNLKPGITFFSDRTAFTGADSDYNLTDDAKLTKMAEEIVKAITEKTQTDGHPILSINALLSETATNGTTVLEHAIEDSGLRRIEAPGGTYTPEERTPSWLSQADVISALAPFLSTRSDTFMIRAYGDINSGSSGLASRAWCEAVIQRSIKPMESGLSLSEMANPLASSFGRQFKIISFRWLTESEI